MAYHGFYVLLHKDINSVFMSINSEIYELLSTNMYYLRANSLNCTIESQLIDGVENTFVVINPCELKTMEVNNSKLAVGGRINDGRKFIETKGVLNEDRIKELLTRFRGMIIGYPHFQLSVNASDTLDSFECDVIRVKGGFKNQFPYLGYSAFSVDFISLLRNGDVGFVKSYKASDVNKKFKITKITKVGQVVSNRNSLLGPSDFSDYINGVKTSYMGTPPYEWKEVKGNITHDSYIPHLGMKVCLDSRIVQLYFSENLYERTYEIISHSSMDPGNDECTESTDRYIWATFAFNESYFVNMIKRLAQSNLVSNFSESFIEFKEPIKKSDFTKLTGIHLFESIINSSFRI